MRGRELAVLLALMVGTAALAAAPEPLSSPIRRTAEYDGAGPDPLYDREVDGSAIRRAGELLPDDTTYYLFAPPDDPVLVGNLKAAGQLFLAPALPVRAPTLADWVLSYKTGRVSPPGVRARWIFPIAEGIFLVRLVG